MSYCHHLASIVNISIFSSETIGPFGTKLGRNIPWVDLYKVFIFGGSNLKHGRQGQLCVLIGWNFKELLWNHLTNWTEIWWEWWGDRPLQSFVGFVVYRKFKMATATGHSLHRTLWENFRTNKSTNSGINPVVVNKHAKIVFFN